MNPEKYENRTCKNGHTCLIHKDRRSGYCPECEKIPVQLPNGEPMVMIPLEQYKQMLPVVTQARYTYRAQSSEGNFVELGFDTHRELLIHLLVGETDEKRIEELHVIWNATQPDRIELPSERERMQRLKKMHQEFRSARTKTAGVDVQADGISVEMIGRDVCRCANGDLHKPDCAAMLAHKQQLEAAKHRPALTPDELQALQSNIARFGLGVQASAEQEAYEKTNRERIEARERLRRESREEISKNAIVREELKPRDGETLGDFAARMDKEHPGRLDFQFAHMTKAYTEQHKCCPVCGGGNMNVTCMGMFGDKDTNRARCDCGWVGIVHDLVARNPDAPTIREANS